MYEQTSNYFGKFFFEFQCGFWQGFSEKHCFIFIIEKWIKSMDKGKTFGVLLKDL